MWGEYQGAEKHKLLIQILNTKKIGIQFKKNPNTILAFKRTLSLLFFVNWLTSSYYFIKILESLLVLCGYVRNKIQLLVLVVFFFNIKYMWFYSFFSLKMNTLFTQTLILQTNQMYPFGLTKLE